MQPNSPNQRTGEVLTVDNDIEKLTFDALNFAQQPNAEVYATDLTPEQRGKLGAVAQTHNGIEAVAQTTADIHVGIDKLEQFRDIKVIGVNIKTARSDAQKSYYAKAA